MQENSKFEGSTAIQIFVDRFNRAGDPPSPIEGRILKNWEDRMPNWSYEDKDDSKINSYFYGGNLKGIEEKLDYIADLNFDTIYITPIDQSVNYHHYDVGNQMEVDPWIGTWDDLVSLCEAAKSKGIKIICDLVFNHTGVNSVYFNDPKCADWYKKDENGNHVFWWGFLDLAEVDTTNEDYQDQMEKVIEKYLSCGVSAIRFDLGEILSKEFFHYIAKAKEKYPEAIYIGEMWGIATDKPNPMITDGQLDSVMNYPISDAILRWCAYGNYENFKYNINRVYNEYPKAVRDVLLNNLGTHDTPMTMTMLADIKMDDGTPIMNPNTYSGYIWDIEAPWRKPDSFDTFGFRRFEADHDALTENEYKLAKNLSKVAISMLYFVPGIACLMQGTEIGESGFKDPFCRKPYNWQKQDEDMKQFIREIGKMRKENQDILKEGEIHIATSDEKVTILERFRWDGHKMVLAVNRTEEEQNINILNDCENLKIIYSTNNSTKNILGPYGIMIAREN